MSDAKKTYIDQVRGEMGLEIMRRRLQKGWSITEMARRADLNRKTVASCEGGDTSSLDSYHKCCVELGIAISWLVSWSETMVEKRNQSGYKAANS